MITIPNEVFYKLLTVSGMYHNLESEQLPELRLALVIMALVIAVAIGLGFLLAHECRENRRLEGVIDQMHLDDLVRLKFPEKEADANVVHEAHDKEAGDE